MTVSISTLPLRPRYLYRCLCHLCHSEDHPGVRRHWLPTDEFLPHWAPRLRNLQALSISYDGRWHLLSTRVIGSLIDLMRHPSLVHVRVTDTIPNSLLNWALAPNVKHLVLQHLSVALRTPEGHLIFPECPTAPVSLESLYVYQPFVFVPFASNSRITITNLRKLVVNSRLLDEHFAILNLLHLCRDTLEEFEINPSFHGMLTSIFDK